MFLSDDEQKKLRKTLKHCPRGQRKAITEHIQLLRLEWGMVENAMDGHAEIVGMSTDGQLEFRMTEAGRVYVETVLLPQMKDSANETL